jgi:hypothetical protein
MSAIDDKYAKLSAVKISLGTPIIPETKMSDGAGLYRQYQFGFICWTPKTGAIETHGAIYDKWNKLGGIKSLLGLPITDETGCRDGSGRFNHFQKGSIYWTPQTGAHEVHGDILAKWTGLGAELSALGYPISDESNLPGGKYNNFQHGAIGWTPAGGAYPVFRPAGLTNGGLDWKGKAVAPPANPVFDAAHSGARANATDKDRLAHLRANLAAAGAKRQQPGRAQSFYPYLLIRTAVGDNGARPLDRNTLPPNLSPDIWIREGNPARNANPVVPPQTEAPQITNIGSYSIAPNAHGFGGGIHSRTSYTILAHVWNLGLAPIVGVKVEFYYAPTWAYDDLPRTARLLAIARCDLASRMSANHSHKMVECPQPLIAAKVNSSVEPEPQTLVVRISSIGDSPSAPWQPWSDRHVAFHALNVL